MKENKRKCVKCGISPADDPDIKLFRFPRPGSTNVQRCELWAKYCYPHDEWSSVDFQKKLHASHKMLCHQHFKESSFIDYPTKQLRKFASPEAEEVTMPCLEHNENVVATSRNPLSDISNELAIPGPSGLRDQSHENILKPAEQSAFKKCEMYLKNICKRQRTFRNKKGKQLLEKLTTSRAVTALSKKISPTFAHLLQGQVKNYKKKPKGRRWTLDMKITALRLYKRSPTCYRLLRRMFHLPAPSSLKGLLKKLELKVGINKHIFKIIGKFAQIQKPVNNEFVLMFDEMAIKKNLHFNQKDEIIEGFQDHGEQGRTPQPASYALVFMVAGIRKRIKQPVAYYLSGSSVTADRLTVLLKEVLGQCYDYGVNITATVCDMDGVNRRALNILGATVSNPYFYYKDHEVVALFDPPHLIKCFRNLFLKYDIEWLTDISSNERVGTGIAKWSHIVQFHELDNTNPNYALAPLLKPEHLNPNTKQKMRVKLAVQVLSHTVSSGMYARIGQGLPAGAIVTADLISKMDKLFDTLNSDTPDLRRGKPFSTNLRNSTPHLEFIKVMKNHIQAMKFIGATRTPPSQEGWIWTLNGVEKLWHTLRQRHPSLKSLATRRLQQDPLENLFGCIRANCGSNCNPTTGQFVGALKTKILSRISHIGVGNCEIDNNEIIIQNIKSLLNCKNKDECSDVGTSSVLLERDYLLLSSDIEISEDSSELQACAYVCGFLVKHFKNKNCDHCLSMLTTTVHTDLHQFIELKEYGDNKSLNYPKKSFVLCAEECATIINAYLENNAHITNLKNEVINMAKANVNFNFLNECTEHKATNMDYIIKNIFIINVKRFCTKKNRAFAVESQKSALKKKIDILAHK